MTRRYSNRNGTLNATSRYKNEILRATITKKSPTRVGKIQKSEKNYFIIFFFLFVNI